MTLPLPVGIVILVPVNDTSNTGCDGLFGFKSNILHQIIHICIGGRDVSGLQVKELLLGLATQGLFNFLYKFK